jgi:hypothetical protein
MFTWSPLFRFPSIPDTVKSLVVVTWGIGIALAFLAAWYLVLAWAANV